MAGEIKLKFSDDSLKSIEQINRGLGEVFNSVKELNKTSININKGVKENAKDLRKLSEDEKVLLAVQKERDKTIQNLAKQEAKLAVAQSEQGKELIKLRTETNQANKASREQAKEQLGLTNAFDKLQKELREAEKAYKDLAISQGHSSKATKDALRNVNDLRARVDAVNQPIGRFNDNVGNYPRLEKFGSLIGKGLGFLGLTVAVGSAVQKLGDFLLSTREVAKEAKGVDFTFKRIKGSSDILTKAINATNGALSKLDIKKSINEFDNFGLSVEALPELLQFVAVRASQTGKSFDSLRDSLVEGLSKESKLRIDNLGISMTELNAEIEKTGDFTMAVANIAKREIAEAGNVIDEAVDNQARWNARMEDFKVSVGTTFNKFINGLLDIVVGYEKINNEASKQSNILTEQQSKFKILTGALKDVNISTEARKKLITQINDEYKDYLPSLITENDTYEELEAKIDAVNKQFIKRIALASFEEEITEAVKKQIQARKDLVNTEIEQAKFNSEQAKKIRQEEEINIGLSPGQAKILEDNQKLMFDVSKEYSEKRINQAEQEEEKIRETYKGIAESLNIPFEEFLSQLDKNFTATSNNANKTDDDNKKINKTLLERIAILQQEKQQYEENIEQINKFLASGKATTENQQALNNELNFYQDKLNDVNGTLESFGATYEKVVDWQKQLTKEIQGVTNEYTELEDALVKAYKNGEISAKDFLKAVDENSAGLNADILKTTIANLEKLLGTEIASADEREEIERKLYEAKKALRDKELQDIKDLAKEKIKTDEEVADAIAKGIEEEQEKRIESAMEWAKVGLELAQMVSQAIFDNKIAKLEEEYNETVRIEQEKQDYLASLLENGAISQEQYNARKARSDKKLADEQKKLEYEKAKAERNQALITAAINTAAAIVQAIAQFGPPPSPAGIAGIASAAIIGATQIALIASKKIPQYAKGKSKHDSYVGVAEVGEKGAELVNYADGSSQLFSKPTYTYLPKGTEVLTATQTRKELQEKYFDSNSTAELKGLRKDLKKKNFNVTVINNGYDFSLQKYLNERV